MAGKSNVDANLAKLDLGLWNVPQEVCLALSLGCQKNVEYPFGRVTDVEYPFGRVTDGIGVWIVLNLLPQLRPKRLLLSETFVK